MPSAFRKAPLGAPSRVTVYETQPTCNYRHCRRSSYSVHFWRPQYVHFVDQSVRRAPQTQVENEQQQQRDTVFVLCIFNSVTFQRALPTRETPAKKKKKERKKGKNVAVMFGVKAAVVRFWLALTGPRTAMVPGCGTADSTIRTSRCSRRFEPLVPTR